MQFEPVVNRQTKIVEREGFVPQEVVVSEEVRMPLWEMARFNTIQNTRNRYVRKRKSSYRDFSTEGGEI